MLVVFTALIAIPPLHQLHTDLDRTGRWQFLELFESVPTHASLKQFEETLARESALSTKARLLYRECLMRWIGQGNEKIVVGRNGFLFFLQEVEMAAGQGILRRRSARVRGIDGAARRVSTDALGAIVDFEHQLRDSGIHLVFVPIPVKPFIYPEQVWPDYPAPAGPAWNRDREPFKAKLAEAGVDVMDVTDDLWNAKAQSGESLFLKLDTHWTPRRIGSRRRSARRAHGTAPSWARAISLHDSQTTSDQFRRPATNPGNPAIQPTVPTPDRRDRPGPLRWRTGDSEMIPRLFSFWATASRTSIVARKWNGALVLGWGSN